MSVLSAVGSLLVAMAKRLISVLLLCRFIFMDMTDTTDDGCRGTLRDLLHSFLFLFHDTITVGLPIVVYRLTLNRAKQPTP